MTTSGMRKVYFVERRKTKTNGIKRSNQEKKWKYNEELRRTQIEPSYRLTCSKTRVTSHDLIGLEGEAQAMRTRQWKPTRRHTRRLGAAERREEKPEKSGIKIYV